MANYLYNGVELPALPQWNRKTYPYAVMIQSIAIADESIKKFSLILSNLPISFDDSAYENMYAEDICSTLGYLYSTSESEINEPWYLQWGEYSRYTHTDVPSGELIGDVAFVLSQNYYTWSNYDVYEIDGTLLCSASYPIDSVTGEEITIYDPNASEPIPVRKLRKGRLICTTIKFPSEYSHNDTWVQKTWSGLSSFEAYNIWSDGTNIYYSYGDTQYVLNGDTWLQKTWNGLTSFEGQYTWTDGTNIYYSRGKTHYVLNGDTWVQKTWSGLTSFEGYNIWSDGTNIYHTSSSKSMILNGDTWVEKPIGGSSQMHGYSIWSDGTNIYATNLWGTHYVLNGDTWVQKTWNGLTSFEGRYTWSDGANVYASDTSGKPYVLNGDTWIEKTWSGLTSFDSRTIWSDGTNIYYSYGDTQYVLERTEATATLDPKSMLMGWIVGRRIAGQRKKGVTA